MSGTIGSRFKSAWNAFTKQEEYKDLYTYRDIGNYSTSNPMMPHLSRGSERSIVTAIYNRIAMDVASYDINHVRVDSNNRFLENINSGLQNCLSVEANKDQTGRAFIHDIVLSMFDEGVVAIVPIDTTASPKISGSYDILSMRTGKIIDWYANAVRVEVYNDNSGQKELLLLPKSIIGIVENPLYAIMNEPNGTLRRLIRKLAILDAIDEQSGSGKLDLIIQLPYLIKTEARQKQAEERRKAIEQQLSGSKYGIAYTDATEQITQLNRPSENNLLAQVTYLTNMLYNQLGISEDVFSGKADAATMLNYYNRTVEPIVTSIIEEMRRKFLTKTARTQGQTIMGFKDVLKLVPATEMAELADSFTRNEILTSNEIRSVIGIKPSTDPQADELRNKNMPVESQPIKETYPVSNAPINN
jgi:ribosomal protein L21E